MSAPTSFVFNGLARRSKISKIGIIKASVLPEPVHAWESFEDDNKIKNGRQKESNNNEIKSKRRPEQGHLYATKRQEW